MNNFFLCILLIFMCFLNKSNGDEVKFFEDKSLDFNASSNKEKKEPKGSDKSHLDASEVNKHVFFIGQGQGKIVHIRDLKGEYLAKFPKEIKDCGEIISVKIELSEELSKHIFYKISGKKIIGDLPREIDWIIGSKKCELLKREGEFKLIDRKIKEIIW